MPRPMNTFISFYCLVLVTIVGTFALVYGEENVQEEISNLRNQAAEYEKLVQHLKGEAGQYETLVQNLRVGVGEHEKLVGTLRGEAGQYERLVGTLRGEVAELHETFSAAEGKIVELERLHNDVSSAKAEIETAYSVLVTESANSVKSYNDELNALKGRANDADMGKKTMGASLNGFRTKYAEMETKSKSDLTQCQADSNNAQLAEIAKRETAGQEAEKEIAAVERKHKRELGQKEDLAKKLSTKTQESVEFKNKHKSVKKQFMQLQMKFAKLENDVQHTLFKINIPLMQDYALDYYYDYVDPMLGPVILTCVDIYTENVQPQMKTMWAITVEKYEQHGKPILSEIEQILEDKGVMRGARDVKKAWWKVFSPYHRKFADLIRSNAKVVLAFYKMNDYHPKAIAALSHVYKYPSKMANYFEWFVAILLALSFIRMVKNLIFSTDPTSKGISDSTSKSDENGEANERSDGSVTSKKKKKKGKNNANGQMNGKFKTT